MSEAPNPAVAALIERITGELLFAQVLIRRDTGGWELRHAEDRAIPAAALRPIDLAQTRSLTQVTATGVFRPLKAAPNLARGWRLHVASPGELEEALERFYPGAVADWFAASHTSPPVTGYREFTGRQTGMYRITTTLNDEQSEDVVRACCHPGFCLKRRLWPVGQLPVDPAAGKSLIPCLEPCALLLELARLAARLTLDAAIPCPATGAERDAELQRLDAALASPVPTVREADFASPDNPRRLRWLREKLARTAVEAERPAR